MAGARAGPQKPRPGPQTKLQNRKPAPEPPAFLTLGWEVGAWIEEFLVHGPGDVQGSPFRLTDEQFGLLLRLYELDRDGRRVIRRAALSRPKGWAKTEFAGAVAAAELAGPVRFAGWNAAGEPVGRPVVAPRIDCYATEEGQAGETYSAAAYMLSHGRAFDEYPLDVGATRTFLAGGGEMLARASAPTSIEGGKTTFGVFDETHLYVAQRLIDMHSVVLRNLGKRGLGSDPWSLETSVMFRPGDGSVWETLYRYWLQLIAGEHGDPELAIRESGILVDHREAPPVELDDDDALEAALRVAYGDAGTFADFRRIIAEIRDPQADEADARRYWLNQPVRGSDAWLDELELEAFDGLAIDWEPPDGELVALGFDGSLSDDATVLVGCTLDEGGVPYLWPVGIWEVPTDATPRERSEWVVDRADVELELDEAFDRWTVVLMYGDPAYWTPELAAWAHKYGDDVVREYPTNRDYRMGPAQDALRVGIATATFEHSGDPRVRRHFANARARRTRHGVCVRKDRPGSPHKIDAAVGYALAFQARNDALAGDFAHDLRKRRRARRRARRKQGPNKLLTF